MISSDLVGSKYQVATRTFNSARRTHVSSAAIRGDEDGVSSCLGWDVGGVWVGWGGVWVGWGGVWVGWGGVWVWVGWDGMVGGVGWGGVCDTIPTIPYHTGVACFLQVRCVEKPRPQPDVAV